ncbi:MAG: PD40 domain-containing protein [Acidobacteria bacterium]|nr:PD40 domain-containing protein [Acidobacteriota bacterium]
MPQLKTFNNTFRTGWSVSFIIVLELLILALVPVSQSKTRNLEKGRSAVAPNATVTVEGISLAVPPFPDSATGNSFIGLNAFSSDGRYVAYTSGAGNLVTGQIDTNNDSDVFVFDRQTGTSEIVSRAAGTTTTTGNVGSASPVISADGRFVAYESTATNLVAGQVDSSGKDIFVFDRQTGTTELVNRAAGTSTTTGNNSADTPAISADGRYIAFRSGATNLVIGQTDTNNANDVFIFDRQTGITQLVSRAAAVSTTTANGVSEAPAINGDGQFVVFRSQATNLVTGQTDTNSAFDSFVFDRQTGTVALVSRAVGTTTTTGNQFSQSAVISADGRYIVHRSRATNLVAGQVDIASTDDLFVFDRQAGTTELVTRAAGTSTTTGNASSTLPVVSSDGRYIAYQSLATNLVTSLTDSNSNFDIFIFDRQTGTTELVSRVAGTSTVTANTSSENAVVSADGRYIAFRSGATNLVTGQTDSNSGNDVFVFDRQTGTTQLVSRAAGISTTTANGVSDSLAISANGQYIGIGSLATDLVSGIFDLGNPDVFLFDRTAGTNSLITLHFPGGIPQTGSNTSGLTNLNLISGDGRYVTFRSSAVNLVTGQIDTNTMNDIFVFDRQTGTAEIVSRAAGLSTTTANNLSDLAMMSADGRYIAIRSRATNLVTGQTDANNNNDIFVFDRLTGTNELVSRAAGTTTTTANNSSDTPVISADGRYIVFRSGATNLVTGQTDTNNANDVFIFDRQTGTTELVSRAAGTTTTTGSALSESPVISADGQYIAFRSSAINLVTGQTDTNNNPDVFVFDRQAGTTELVSRAAGTTTTTGSAIAESPVISADGRYIAFRSGANNLVPGQTDTNSAFDIFVFDRQTGTTELVSRAAGTTTTTGVFFSDSPTINADGRYIAFRSLANNLVIGQIDTNDAIDVFVFDRQTGTTELVSRAVGTSITTGNGLSEVPMISADGQVIAFQSSATNLVAGQTDTKALSDVFVLNRTNQEIILVSGAAGSPTITGNAASAFPVMTPNGQYIGFNSNATDLIPGDLNAAQDVFLAEIGQPIAATISGGGVICGSSGRNPVVMVTITGGTPPYTVALTNGGGTQTGASPLLFNVSPASTTTYMFQSGMDSIGMPIMAEGSAVVTVLTEGTADAGPDQTVCDSNPNVTLAGVIGGSATTGTWSGGAGTFSPNATTVNATYTPTAGELAAGTVTLTLTTSGSDGDCSVDSDTVTINFVSCDPASVLMVADTTNNRVQRFDGETWSVIGVGTVGSGNGQFRLPEAVSFDTAGRIYVADTGNNRIQWSTDAGVTWADFATSGSATNQVQGPQGVTLDSTGNLYVSDTGNRRVLRFNGGVPGTGVVIASTGTTGGQVMSPRGLVIDDTFRLFVADEGNSKIMRIPNANTVTTPASGSIVAGSGTGLNKVQNPQGVAIGPAGTLYVADTGNSRILAWLNANPNNSTALATTGTLLGKVNNAEGIVVKTFTAGPSAGTTLLVVSDTGNNRIQGKELPTGGWSLVGAPNNVGSGVGQFRGPSKIQ